MKPRYIFPILAMLLLLVLAGSPALGYDGGPPILPHAPGQEGPPPEPCKNPKCCEQPGAPSWSVNMVNLNLYMADTPLWYTVPVGPPVRLRLSYNSMAPVIGQELFGNKWSFAYSSFLDVDGQGNVTLTLGNGRSFTYPATDSGYGHPYRNTTTLVKVADNHFEIHYFSGKVRVYDHVAASGRILLTAIRDVHNQSVTLSYDGQDRLESITDALGNTTSLLYNGDNLVRQMDGPFSRSATFTYDSNRNLTAITDMGGYRTRLEYDAASLLTALVNDAGRTEFYIEPADHTGSSQNYPPPGAAMKESSRITVTHPDGGREEFYYIGTGGYSWHVAPEDYIEYRDASHNNYTAARTVYHFADTAAGARAEIRSVTYPDGRKRLFTIDHDTGRILSEADASSNSESLTYNAQGSVLTRTLANGEQITYEYEDNGIDRKKMITGLGTTEYTHDAFHRLTSVTDALGHTINYQYNSLGQLIKTTDPLGVETINTYDANHRLVRVTRAGQVLSEMTYDPVGRLHTVTDATGQTMTYAYDDFDHVTEVTYSDGRSVTLEYGSGAGPHLVTRSTDRSGRVTINEYNAAKQLVRSVNPEGGVSRYEYDGNSNLVRFIDPNGNPTSFTYNSGNQLVKKTFADGKYFLYAYYPTGLLKSRTNSRGIRTDYFYDELHHLVRKSYTDATPEVTITYDNFGRPTAITDGTGVYGLAYNEISQLLSIDGPLADDTITYHYDNAGRRTGFDIDQGRSVSYGLDALNRLTGITVGSANFTYAYPDARSPLVQSLTRPNNLVTSYQYNGLHQLTELANTDSASSLISRYAFTYNDHDLRATEEITGAPLPSGFTAGLRTFSYNALNQLLSGANPDQQFGYDDDGNLTTGFTPEGYGFTATYDAEDRLQSIEYTDSNGVANKRVYTYRWDSFIGRIQEYADNSLTSDISIVRDGHLALQDRETATNAVVREYVWGQGMGGGIGGLLSMRQNGQDYFYLYDGKGNVTAVVDSSQQVVATYQYNGFGRLMQESGTLDQPFRFSTKRYDKGAGLSYYGYRFYAPAIERWLTRDPLGEAGGINLYGFVGNDPVNAVDPWGLDYEGAVYNELRKGRDWLLRPDHWWNDPNHWTTTSVNLGEVAGKMACFSGCMGKKYPIIAAGALAESAVVGAISIVAGPGGTVIVMHVSAIADADTATAVTMAIAECVKECSCEK